MKWPLRILWTICTLLWLGVLGLWVRSYWFVDVFTVGSHAPMDVSTVCVCSRAGLLETSDNFIVVGHLLGQSFATTKGAPSVEFHRWGSVVRATAVRNPGGDWPFHGVFPQHFSGFESGNPVFPHWVLAAFLTPVVLWPLPGRFRRWHRRRRGLCVKCSYDLRASPERCPECGTPVNGRRPNRCVTLVQMPGQRVS